MVNITRIGSSSATATRRMPVSWAAANPIIWITPPQKKVKPNPTIGINWKMEAAPEV